MPKFLVTGSYTAEGLQGLQTDKATGRRRALKKAVASLGGKLESMYFSFGDDDIVVLVDMPSNASAAAVSIAAASSGVVRVKSTPLLTVEEVDEALELAPTYRPPGVKGFGR
jgi:uncharacterized protein with GYD domain